MKAPPFILSMPRVACREDDSCSVVSSLKLTSHSVEEGLRCWHSHAPGWQASVRLRLFAHMRHYGVTALSAGVIPWHRY